LIIIHEALTAPPPHPRECIEKKNINKNFENLSLLFEIKIYEEFEDYIYITCNSLKEPKCSQQLGNHNPTSNCVIITLLGNHEINYLLQALSAAATILGSGTKSIATRSDIPYQKKIKY